MTSFPVRTTAHQHMQGVLWSVLSLCPTHTFIYQRPHLTLSARVTAALITLSARCDKWAQNHFTILHYHAACRSCPKNRMWSHLHCCVQKNKKKQSHDAAFFSFQLVNSIWLLPPLFSWHYVDIQSDGKSLNGFKHGSSRVNAVKMGYDGWLVTKQQVVE